MARGGGSITRLRAMLDLLAVCNCNGVDWILASEDGAEVPHDGTCKVGTASATSRPLGAVELREPTTINTCSESLD